MTIHINPLLFEEEHLVRQIDRNGENWFVGVDVCRVLGLANPYSSLALLDEDEKGLHSVETLGGNQDLIIVSEAGVYRLVFKSRKPVAERFKRWLAHEVIPAIRKTGAFGQSKGVTGEASAADDMKENDAVKLRKVTECRHVFGNPAAAQLWFRLGLEDVPAMHHDPRQITIWDYSTIKPAPEPAETEDA